MTKLGEKQVAVLQYLEGRGFCGPSEIGRACWIGKKTKRSGAATVTCKTLMKRGLVERSSDGKYRVIAKHHNQAA